MPPRQTEEEQADFARALQAVAEQGPLPQAELDSLSVLEGPDFERFRSAWNTLPAPAKARLIIALRGAAEDRLRLDFSALNLLALDDPDPQVRLAGVQAAIEDKSPQLLRKLLDLVEHDPNIDVRWGAAEDLSRFTLLCELEDLDAATTEAVRSRLNAVVADESQAPKVRGAALAALGYFSDPETAETLATAFLNQDLRVGAVRGMGRTADPRWTDRLMPVLGSDDPQQRLEAARALGEIEDERAVTPLVELVDDPDQDVRLAVIEALGHIGGEEAREALLYLAEAVEDPIREAAKRALEELDAADEDPLDS
jgi:HEAT repeat protein